MRNRYEIRGEVTAIFIKRKDGSEVETLIDTKDFELVNSMPNTWKITSDGKFNYAGAHLPRNKQPRKFVRLHRLITGATKGYEVDHINHDTLDNRRINLRVITKAENLQNRVGAQSNSKSGVRGVVWNNSHKKWRAQYKQDGKCHHVGSFNTLEEAAKAISEARKTKMPFSKEDAG